MELTTASVVLLGLSVALLGVAFAVAYHGSKKVLEGRQKIEEAMGIFRDNGLLLEMLETVNSNLNAAKGVLYAVRVNNFSFRHMTGQARDKLAEVLGLEELHPATDFNRYRLPEKMVMNYPEGDALGGLVTPEEYARKHQYGTQSPRNSK